MTELRKELLDITNNLRTVIIACGKSEENTYGILTSTRRSFGEVVLLMKETNPNSICHLRKFNQIDQLKKLEKQHRSLKLYNIKSDLKENELLSEIQNISPIYYENKGFAVIDLCKFSTRPLGEQISLRLMLEQALRNAKSSLLKNKSDIWDKSQLNINYSSTGDGFYFWNEKTSRHLDSILFTYLILVLCFLKKDSWGAKDINLRAAFGIGECYIFNNSLISDEHNNQDAIGDVLNDLARLLSSSVPGQLLLLDFKVEKKEDKSISNPSELIKCTPFLFNDHVQGIFRIEIGEKMKIYDKHNLVHYCNNIYGEAFYIQGGYLKGKCFGVIEDKSINLLDISYKKHC